MSIFTLVLCFIPASSIIDTIGPHSFTLARFSTFPAVIICVYRILDYRVGFRETLKFCTQLVALSHHLRLIDFLSESHPRP